MNRTAFALAYHRCGTPPAGVRYKGLFVTPRILSLQIRLLRWAGFEFCHASDVLTHPGKRVCAITFDDGYRDNLENALPVLRELNVPATVFVVTDDVGKHGHVWTESGETNPADLMDLDELRQLGAAGWEVASHSAAHIHLARRSREEQTSTLRQSIVWLDEHGFGPARSVAYPYGSVNEDTVLAMSDSGFEMGFTTVPGTIVNPNDRFRLNRYCLKGYRLYHVARVLRLIAAALLNLRT